ncbi:hypothetical protein OHT20_32725 [Streptomyces caniferus]|uniref:Uncharacterized protein n=1 Tax=Streptomyces caniferus TaxID=285557 RepID=A0A640SDH5_9ACTN|nr:hypothetical protein [Streptomyces caniferus]GFE08542.1 hypothetical protein Scani_48100 [Streptomyces caniferus]
MDDEAEVVDAELADNGHLPAAHSDTAPSRPVVDRHTILARGEALPTEAGQLTYTERDLYVSEATAERLKNKSKPRNTSKTCDSQRGMLKTQCEQQSHVHRPCTTATYVAYVATFI